jgi:formate hydrogenlyase subunit 4
MSAFVAMLVLLVLAPMMPAVATRTIALLTGRRGPPLLQPYRDLRRLFGKGVVYAHVTTWVFAAAPMVYGAAALLAATLVPLDGRSALVHFPGDMFLFAGLLAVGRVAISLAALDTGSSFEGMGASRALMIGGLAEPVLLVVLFSLALATGGSSLSDLLGGRLTGAWRTVPASLVMVAISLVMLLLAEAGRGPIDDPATHLELTMIHEVMVLDHSGPDFALILYGASLHFALLGALLVCLLWPAAGLATPWAAARLAVGLLAVAAVAGVIEFSMARLRMSRIPQYLVSAGVLGCLSALLLLR